MKTMFLVLAFLGVSLVGVGQGGDSITLQLYSLHSLRQNKSSVMQFYILVLIAISIFSANPTLLNAKIPASDIISPDGSIICNSNLKGQIDFAGYHVKLDPKMGPIFMPAPLIAGWNPLGSGLSDIVYAIAVDDNNVYVGGEFQAAGGNPDANWIAHWDGNTWNALGSDFNNPVYTIAISGGDVYAGGSFTNAGGNPNCDQIARWDGNTWNPLGNGIGNTVFIIVPNGSDLIIGGAFTNVNGNSNADGIVRWDGNTWHSYGNGLNGLVDAIAVQGNDIYAGGGFHNVGGIDWIARWDNGDNAWHALGAGVNQQVTSLLVIGSDVYVGGYFTNAGGNSNADYLARWDGGTWNAVGSGLNAFVSCIIYDGADIIIGGDFTNAGGNPDADKITRWDGSAWHAYGTGLNFLVRTAAISGPDLYVGGAFTNAGGNSNADKIARWESPPLPVEWLYFNGELSGASAIQLKWGSVSEANNSHFVVERSANGYEFEEIGRVNALGNTNQTTHYSFRDNLPDQGTNYYRLKRFDYNGNYEFTNIVAVEFKKTMVAIFPNPANDYITINGLSVNASRVRILDFTGIVIMELILMENGCNIDLQDVRDGLLFLEIETSNMIIVQKLIKNNH